MLYKLKWAKPNKYYFLFFIRNKDIQEQDGRFNCWDINIFASKPPQSMKSLQNAIATMASIAISIYKCFHLGDKGEDSFKSNKGIIGLPLSIHVNSVILYRKPFQCHTRYKSRGNDADAFEREREAKERLQCGEEIIGLYNIQIIKYTI